jgi:hypothetical protein
VRVSATGLILDDHPDVWLNVSRFGPAVDLRSAHVGDIALAQVEVGGDGRCYLTSLRVLPLDGLAPAEAGEEPRP